MIFYWTYKISQLKSYCCNQYYFGILLSHIEAFFKKIQKKIKFLFCHHKFHGFQVLIINPYKHIHKKCSRIKSKNFEIRWRHIFRIQEVAVWLRYFDKSVTIYYTVHCTAHQKWTEPDRNEKKTDGERKKK